MVNDIKPVIRNGALFFVLNYVRFRTLMRFKGISPDAYIAKYLPYQKMYLRYLMTGKKVQSEIITMSKAELCAKNDDITLLKEIDFSQKDIGGC